MKTLFLPLAIISLLFLSPGVSPRLMAAEEPITASFRLQRGKDVLTAPKVTAKPDTFFKIEVPRAQQAPGIIQHTGVVLEGKATHQAEKIAYTVSLTLRDFDEAAPQDPQKVPAFRTREYVISGEAAPVSPCRSTSAPKMGNRITPPC